MDITPREDREARQCNSPCPGHLHLQHSAPLNPMDGYAAALLLTASSIIPPKGSSCLWAGG